MEDIASKQCGNCGERKPLHQFNTDRGRPDGKYAHCKACNRAQVAAWQASNPEQVDIKDAELRSRKRGWQPPDLTVNYLRSIQIDCCHACGSIPGKLIPAHFEDVITDKGEALRVAIPHRYAMTPQRLQLDCVRPSIRQYRPGNVGYLCPACNVTKRDRGELDLIDKAYAAKGNRQLLAAVKPNGKSDAMSIKAIRYFQLARYVADPEGIREHWRKFYAVETTVELAGASDD